MERFSALCRSAAYKNDPSMSIETGYRCPTGVEDRIVLENGYGSVLLESSKESGLSIEDFDALLPNIRMGEIDEHSFKRTNITYSSVVKSSNITNSTLSSL